MSNNTGMQFDAVILAGGDYPTAPQPLEVLHSAPYVVCCDGAADRYIATGRVPDAIVGDGDSISTYNRAKYAHLLQDAAKTKSSSMLSTKYQLPTIFPTTMLGMRAVLARVWYNMLERFSRIMQYLSKTVTSLLHMLFWN